MSTSLRDEAAKALDKDRNVRVLLASLRAAGVGINLVAADTAILADSCMPKPPYLRCGPCLLTKSRVGSRYRGTGRRQGAPPRPDPNHKGIPACRKKFRRGGRSPNPGSKEGACRDGLPGKVQGPIGRELLGHGQGDAWLGGLGKCLQKFCKYGRVLLFTGFRPSHVSDFLFPGSLRVLKFAQDTPLFYLSSGGSCYDRDT